jgi:parallel beta-helix repeat protein
MKKYVMIVLVFLLSACGTQDMKVDTSFETLEPTATGTTYYVSGSGSDSNNGLSSTTAFRTLQRAADQTQPGDTVLAMNGTYTHADTNGSVLSISTSGRADAWIRYQNYPGHAPFIKVRNWNGIDVDGADYIIVEGFTLEGNRDEVSLDYARSETRNTNNPITSGNCIGVVSRAHHVIVRKNKVSKCPGGGIYSLQADYLRIEDNVVWGNSFYSPYGNSGISMYQNWNSDTTTTTKMVIRRNVVYSNNNFIPCSCVNFEFITDGNGIIIDDGRNTQNGGTGAPYRGKTLITNNIVYENGGRAIHVFLSDNVTILNNTTYRNSFNPAIDQGEITSVESSNVRVYNNIIYARSDRPSNTRLGTQSEKNSQVYDYNLVFDGTNFDTGQPNNIFYQDPRFVNISAKDFRLQTNSPAIDAGTSNPAAPRDFNNVVRPQGNGVDIGAFEIR